MQKFKALVANLKPQNFELLLEYIKASIESVPYDPNCGTLSPRDIRGFSITAPMELALNMDKSKLFQGARKIMSKALRVAFKAIKDSSFASNNMFYHPKTTGLVLSPREGDICLVSNPGELGKKVRQGVIVSLGKTTIKVRFPNGHVNDFNGSQEIFISRPPLTSENNGPPEHDSD